MQYIAFMGSCPQITLTQESEQFCFLRVAKGFDSDKMTVRYSSEGTTYFVTRLKTREISYPEVRVNDGSVD
jgi:hypothetical protein